MRRLISALAACVTVLGLVLVAPVARAEVPDPVPVRTIGFPGHAGLYGWGAATMRDGSVLIGDYWNYRVLRFAPDGTSMGTFIQNHGGGATQHGVIYGIGIDPRNGDVYISDNDRKRLHKYSESGQYLFTFGSAGQGENKFSYPSRIAVADDGLVFISDMWQHVVSVHDPDTGLELYSFGSFGTDPGQLNYPRSMAFDDQQRLFLVNGSNNRIEVFDKAGTYLFNFGFKGPGGFGGDLRGISIDRANDWVYVVDAIGNKIHKFDTDGNFITKWGSQGTGQGQFIDGGREVTVDHDGNVWVGDYPNWRAQKFSPTGTFLLEVPGPVVPPPPGGFNGAEGMAVDAAGNVFVADTYNQRIEKLAPDGTYITEWGIRGEGAYGYNYPRGMDVSKSDGTVVVADSDNHYVKKYDNDGNFLWEAGGFGFNDGFFRNLQGLDLAPDNSVFAADSRNTRIQVLDPDGNWVRSFGSEGTGDGQFRYPRGVAVDTDGTVWVADSIRDDVQHFTTEGVFLGKVGTKGTAVHQLDAPFDLEVDEHNVYVADTSANLVKIYRKSDGAFLHAFGGPGQEVGDLNTPMGMDITADGHLFVLEKFNDRVTEFSLDGTGGYEPDVTPPEATVTDPANGEAFPLGPVNMSGTASDDRGVASVSVAIQNSATGEWWRGGNTWGSYLRHDTAMSSPRSTSTDWSFSWTPPAAGSYGMQVIAVDTSGLQNFPKPWRGFTVYEGALDVEDPDGTVAVPAPGVSLPAGDVTMSGSATDDVSVTSVRVSVYDRGSGLWWQSDGSWGPWSQHEAVLSNPGETSTDWSFTWPGLAAGDYAMQIDTRDGAGHRDPTKPWVTFGIYEGAPDVEDPDGTVAVPAAGGMFPLGDVAISGAATDDVGVVSVHVAIQDTVTKQWWQSDGSWGPWSQHEAVLSNPGETSTDWSFMWPGVAAGNYALQIYTTDGAGRVDPTKPWVTFSVYDVLDVADPTVDVTVPVPNQVFSAGPVPFSGSGYDDVGVTGVSVAVQDRATGLWLRSDGTWGAYQLLPSALGSPGATTTAWTFDRTLATGTYGLQVVAFDAVGNQSFPRPWVPFTVS